MARRLAGLLRDIDLLRRQFLPDPFDLLGVYPQAARVQAHTRAFLVLSHAELETYFEEWAREIARASELVWVQSRRITSPLAFLLSWGEERLTIPEKLGGATAVGVPRLEQIAKKVFEAYYTSVNKNNGLKEKNVLRLFGPLGVHAAAFTGAILPNLDELGSIRGTHAHGAQKAVASVLDPETEYKRIHAILKDLDILEKWLLAYRRVIR